MLKPKVSVIIPSYNSLDYIERTLEAIFQQTYSNIEVIVIDDHSTDKSLDFLKSINKKTLVVEKNKNKGACAARNYGLQIANGDYIQFLDADDILSPNKIEEQVNLAVKYGKEFVYSCQWMPFVGDISTASEVLQPLNKSYKNTLDWLNDSWTGNGMGQTAIWLTHRDIIEKSGAWNENLLINQDGEFFSRVLLEAKEIKYSDKGIVYYRKGNVNSISQLNTQSKDKAISLLKSYLLYKDSARQYNKLNELKKGLGHNFLVFMNQYFKIYPDLAKKAEQEFYDLGFSKMWPVGGGKFKVLASIFGLKTALRLRNVLKQ